jgi:chemotaxis protein methyltransferase WspC
MKRFEHLLRTTIGLDAESIGSTSIQRVVRLRMKRIGLSNPADYEQLLERSRAEWNEFVESVIVAETWFFRDPATVAAFVRHAMENWLPAHPFAPLRLLSIACASGEEPYSLVMALLDAGVAPDRFQIDAVDISARALARAEAGVYGRNSYRGKDLAFRSRYFQPANEGFVLLPPVRKCVRFHRGNLFSDGFLPGHPRYNFIFCRNLLIYFDRSTQRRALERIEGLLASSGLLFVGPVERPMVLSHGFANADIPEAFVCREAGHVVSRPGVDRFVKLLPVSAGFQTNGAAQPPLPANDGLKLPPAGEPAPSVQPDLETARRLADAGCLREAAEICEAYLRQSRVSAQAYYLLGLVRETSGGAGAFDCYRKALYLDPEHYECLLQMALLLQKNGEPARARTFRNRAQRIKAKV